MHAIQLIQEGFDHVHVALREDLAEVEPEWLFWQPEPGLNHIGFLFWHLVRDEDQVVSWLAREPQLWPSEGWHERFGMDAKEQGTGMDASRLESFRYALPEFMEYAEGVWARTGPLLATLSEDDLDKPAWKDSPWNIGRQLVEGVLCHAWVHLGEIRAVMGLRGWRFRE
ncbi:MAG: DinB family protein [Tepidiformaceae bacterium]